MTERTEPLPIVPAAEGPAAGRRPRTLTDSLSGFLLSFPLILVLLFFLLLGKVFCIL